ncbi:sugar phosphate isomerase/epimerase family protein [Citricoccus nitrophenolicus]|uniref:sugar phosphate isomerase/epimerase family protein n=1 Tax=Citricoccus nitrophenolicus TaxID=863575 RepID=UPI0039B3A9B8
MTPTQQLHLGVAPLSALDLPVLDYVRAAANAGFAAVGLRVEPVSAGDPTFPRDLTSPQFRELEAALTDANLEVLDVEVFSVDPGTTRSDWLQVMEVGARLGASYLNIVGGHDSAAEFEDIVGQLSGDARDHDLLPVLEPVAYRPFNDFSLAVQIARNVGCAVEMDVLHFLRTGTSLDLVREHRDLFPVFQLCDAPASMETHGALLQDLAATGEGDPAVAESRSLRLLPGDGDGPIRELLSILGDRTRISVEIPNVKARGDLSAEEYLALLHNRAQHYLADGE